MSDNPKIVLFEGRGGRLRCGEWIRDKEDGRILLKTNPGTTLANTSIREEKKLSPLEACERHNRLLDKLEHSQEEREHLAREFEDKAQEIRGE